MKTIRKAYLKRRWLWCLSAPVLFTAAPRLGASAPKSTTSDPLQGIWRGSVQTRLAYDTEYHHVSYAAALDLQLDIGELEVHGQGTAHVSDPVITPVPDRSILHARPEWNARYEPNVFPVTLQGYRAGGGNDVIFVRIEPAARVQVRMDYQDRFTDRTHRDLDFIGAVFPDSIPISRGEIGHFASHKVLKRGEGFSSPADLIQASQENVQEGVLDVQGNFHQVWPISWLAIVAALLGFAGLAGVVLKAMGDSFGAGLAWALLGAVLSAVEKLKEWGVLAPSVNPSTGLSIPGTHLAYPWQWLGRAAQGAGIGLAAIAQFKESKEIWQSEGTALNRGIREGAAIGINVMAASAGALVVAVSAETGPGIALGLIGAAAIGAAGEAAKYGIHKAVNRWVR